MVYYSYDDKSLDMLLELLIDIFLETKEELDNED
jgi:hypothetical protein